MACIIFFTEFAENGSIYDYIHKDHKQPPIIWATQVAKGMFMEVKAMPLIATHYIRNVASLLPWYLQLSIH